MIGLLIVAGLSLVIAGLGALLLREVRQSYRYRQCLLRCAGRAYDIEVTARRTANPRMIMAAGAIQDDVQKTLDLHTVSEYARLVTTPPSRSS